MEYNQSTYTEINLGNGKVSKVSIEDAPRLSMQKWWVYPDRRQDYAMRWKYLDDGRRDRLLLHRALLQPEDGEQVDHKNHDGLDNRRCNLRLANHSTNQMNSRKRSGTSSKYKGVTWRESRGKWHARIYKDGREKHLGYFSDEVDAAKAYNVAALEMFGEFANPNQIDN